MAELWSEANTKQEIINRSGTKLNSGVDMDAALRDAENRLTSGGSIFGKRGNLNLFGNKTEDRGQNTTSISMSVNAYLWRGALETINFMPLSSADPIGGTIITDWYSTTNNQSERCKLNIFILGKDLKTENLKVTSFCQEFKNEMWVNKNIDKENNLKIENAILNKAKNKTSIKLKVSSRYNHKLVEKNGRMFGLKKIFLKHPKIKKKILCFRDVSLPIRKDTYGSC